MFKEIRKGISETCLNDLIRKGREIVKLRMEIAADIAFKIRKSRSRGITEDEYSNKEKCNSFTNNRRSKFVISF